MSGQESYTRSPLYDWVDSETRHIDVIASWENMCLTYDALRFTDPLSDGERLDEFKWITHNMNTFLTRARKKLMSCKDREAMTLALQALLTPSGRVELGERKALVYQKLRQQWIIAAIRKLDMMSEDETERI